MEHYFEITLNQEGIIFKFESNIKGLDYQEKDIVGKSWFDIFIEPTEQERFKKLFEDHFHSEDFFNTPLWKHTTDIKTQDGHHKLIDFENTILIYPDGRKALYMLGLEYFEHMENYE